ncbi:lipoate--protein ligase family protein [Oceanobacillus piezotolerans]|uniref:Lipoate--protein ligase family protein n=1 Tax=Oceanobacillus piezotolerans TaxID=2448030 RepID=A0A498D516_9BACI|nr:lipoate--protein ligase family protein [Oceanobacillus piezotolerans]RLL42041.1 lipoate--protein ligase family protein [Oceanobacillus piezotolerans]
MKEDWYFLDSGHLDGAINMALDECLLNWHSKRIIPPTLRFYGWNNPTLSAGQFQKVHRSINFAAIQNYQCQFVRRLTGGSAVLHDDELTYSIVVSEDHPAIPTSIREAYHILSKGLYEGYKNLGIQVDYAYPDRESSRENTAVCFEKAAFYEMVVDGKKLSGNAQTRKNGVLLQHGSIPMSMNIDMLYNLFQFPSEKIKQRKREAFKTKAITINELTNKNHTYDMMKAAFLEGFKIGLNISLHPFELNENQWDEVHHLAETKYRSDDWNFKRMVKEPIKDA